jgi:hypothetical protein
MTVNHHDSQDGQHANQQFDGNERQFCNITACSCAVVTAAHLEPGAMHLAGGLWQQCSQLHLEQ